MTSVGVVVEEFVDAANNNAILKCHISLLKF
jgi:hypothetical protein